MDFGGSSSRRPRPPLRVCQSPPPRRNRQTPPPPLPPINAPPPHSRQWTAPAMGDFRPKPRVFAGAKFSCVPVLLGMLQYLCASEQMHQNGRPGSIDACSLLKGA